MTIIHVFAEFISTPNKILIFCNSITWCCNNLLEMWQAVWYHQHIQLLWTNHNPVLKVTPFFDAVYLTNGYRCGHSYYSRQIGNTTQAFEWHQFNDLEWPLSQISRSKCNSTSNNSKMVQDRAIVTMPDQYKVTHGLSNRAIFNDLERTIVTVTDFKVRPFFHAEYLRNG